MVVTWFGYKRWLDDYIVFVKRKKEKVVMLIMYVENIVVTGNYIKKIKDLNT